MPSTQHYRRRSHDLELVARAKAPLLNSNLSTHTFFTYLSTHIHIPTDLLLCVHFWCKPMCEQFQASATTQLWSWLWKSSLFELISVGTINTSKETISDETQCLKVRKGKNSDQRFGTLLYSQIKLPSVLTTSEAKPYLTMIVSSVQTLQCEGEQAYSPRWNSQCQAEHLPQNWALRWCPLPRRLGSTGETAYREQKQREEMTKPQKGRKKRKCGDNRMQTRKGYISQEAEGHRN